MTMISAIDFDYSNCIMELDFSDYQAEYGRSTRNLVSYIAKSQHNFKDWARVHIERINKLSASKDLDLDIYSYIVRIKDDVFNTTYMFRVHVDNMIEEVRVYAWELY